MQQLLFDSAKLFLNACMHAYIGTVYAYLAEGIGRDLTEQGSTFRALTRGYIHWASGRMDQMEINTRHPEFCHVKCCMNPSMKPGVYHVYILLRRDGEVGNVCTATCECAAGYVYVTHIVTQK